MEIFNEVSMMTIKVVMHLITGQVQFRRPLHCCLGSQLDPSLSIPGNFSGARLLVNPIMAPSIEKPYYLVSLCCFPVLTILFPQVFLPLLFSPFLPFLPSLPPHDANFLRSSCLCPLPRDIYEFPRVLLVT